MMMMAAGPAKLAPPGRYRVVLTVDGVELTQWLRVEPDLSQSTNVLAEEDEKSKK